MALTKEILFPQIRLEMGHNRDLGYVKAFGRHLKKLRTDKGLSQEELSYKCVIPTSQIGRFERGERSPTLSTIRILADGLGEEPKALLDFRYKARKDQ